MLNMCTVHWWLINLCRTIVKKMKCVRDLATVGMERTHGQQTSLHSPIMRSGDKVVINR